MRQYIVFFETNFTGQKEDLLRVQSSDRFGGFSS